MVIEGQVALITGAASGLGEATATWLATRGAKVALLDCDADGLERVATATAGLLLTADVTDAASAAAALETAEAQLGPPAILVNCAGIATGARIYTRGGPMPLDDFERVIRINLTGTFNIMRLAARAMAGRTPNDEGERGVIINTSSISAEDGQIGQTAYAASKGGVAALTLPAARELARDGIRVVAIAPGPVATPMLLGMSEEVRTALAATVPFPPRLARPDEFARLVEAIITNPMLNGTTIRLDGATRMPPR